MLNDNYLRAIIDCKHIAANGNATEIVRKTYEGLHIC